MVRRFWVGGVDGRATLRLCHLLEVVAHRCGWWFFWHPSPPLLAAVLLPFVCAAATKGIELPFAHPLLKVGFRLAVLSACSPCRLRLLLGSIIPTAKILLVALLILQANSGGCV